MSVPEPPGGGAAALAIVVNGLHQDVPRGATALDVVVQLGIAGRPVAVEVNEQVVPRSQLAACILHEGDRMEIVTLVGGG